MRRAVGLGGLTFLVCGFLLWSVPLLADAKAPEPLESLRVVLILDVNAEKIGRGVAKDGEVIRSLMSSIFESPKFPNLNGKMQLDVIGGKEGVNVTPKEILDYFTTHPIRENEALFVFSSSHGGLDVTIQGGHFLALSGGDLSRMKLVSTIENLNPAPKLRILVTNSCNSLGDFQGLRAGIPTVVYDQEHEDLYKRLFLGSRGTTDFNAADYTQFAWINIVRGGFMTNAFDFAMKRAGVPDDKNPADGKTPIDQINWREIFSRTKRETQATFLESQQQAKIAFLEGKVDNEPSILKSKAQTPVVFGVAAPSENYVSSVYTTMLVGPEAEGLKLRTALHIDDLKGRTIRATAILQDKDGKLIAHNEKDGSIIVIDSANFNLAEHSMFVPRAHLPAPGDEDQLIVGEIQLFDEKSGATIAKSVPFRFLLGSKKTK